MKGASHLLIGLGAAAVVHRIYAPFGDSWQALALAGVAAAVGALLPDVDSDESIIRRSTGTARSGGCIGKLASLGISAITGGHRVGTHTAVAWLVISGLAWIAGQASSMSYVAIAFSIGYLSHLLADAITVEGIPLFWPLAKRRVCLLPSFIAIRTGTFMEYAFMVAFGVGVVKLWLS
jgi:inner membrane protein